jgi:glutamine amidotransferase
LSDAFGDLEERLRSRGALPENEAAALDKLFASISHDHESLPSVMSIATQLGFVTRKEPQDEENVDCLGVIPGVAARLPGSPDFPVPNMGWCPIRKSKVGDVLDGLDNGTWFYFVHSYALPVSDLTLASAEHAHPFAAVVRQGNFLAAQFHPERSSAAGARFLQNFLRWQP